MKTSSAKRGNSATPSKTIFSHQLPAFVHNWFYVRIPIRLFSWKQESESLVDQINKETSEEENFDLSSLEKFEDLEIKCQAEGLQVPKCQGRSHSQQETKRGAVRRLPEIPLPTFSGAMPPFSTVLGTTFVMLNVINMSNSQDLVELDLESTLDCHKRSYTHKVTQSDSEGRVCWDMVTVMSCWGRCDSNEISDWRFPYKRSHHPVCIHGDRAPKTVLLSNCEEGVEAGTEVHEYLEAISCQCSLCKSSEANCQGVRYRGENELLSFLND